MNVPAIGGFSGTVQADSPEKLRKSAGDFESLLISQMLRQARESGGGWLGAGDDQTASSMMELAEEHLGTMIAKAGGFGLNTLVMQGLHEKKGPEQASPAAPGPKS